jgi:hypothetical protein
MDVSPAATVSSVVDMQKAQTDQQVQIAVLKKAMAAQSSNVLGLLQGIAPPTTGPQPLATSGNLGTRLNETA